MNTSTSSESAGAFDKANAVVLASPVKASAFTLLMKPVTPASVPVFVIVLVAPEPVAVTLSPTKFNVVAPCDNDDPYSCMVIVAPVCLA